MAFNRSALPPHLRHLNLRAFMLATLCQRQTIAHLASRSGSTEPFRPHSRHTGETRQPCRDQSDHVSSRLFAPTGHNGSGNWFRSATSNGFSRVSAMWIANSCIARARIFSLGIVMPIFAQAGALASAASIRCSIRKG